VVMVNTEKKKKGEKQQNSPSRCRSISLYIYVRVCAENCWRVGLTLGRER
jgi:hypothetical protein